MRHLLAPLAATLLLAACASDGGTPASLSGAALARRRAGLPPALPAVACESLAGPASRPAGCSSAVAIGRRPRQCACPTLNAPTAFCRDARRGTPLGRLEIQFEVWLPSGAQAWSGPLQKLNGTGGRRGHSLPAAGCRTSATASSRPAATWGHDDGGEAAARTLNHPRGCATGACARTHHVATAAKALARAYYGSPVRHAYFEGCSTAAVRLR